MKQIRKVTGMILALGMTVGMITAAVQPAYAGTITSVGIKVGLSVDAGESLPGISIGDSSGDCYVYTTSSKYSITDAEWITSETSDMSVGDEPKMKVYLTPDDSDDYYFKGSYHSSNVNISGGTFVSAKKDGDDLIITLKTKGIKGQFDEPEEAYWKNTSGSNLGYAKWSAGENSSHYYDVYLYKGSSAVKKLEDYNGTSYNFYPYMTKKGTYTFKVRTVPHTSTEKEYGKKSEWLESDELYLAEEDVSDGSGQTDSNGVSSSNGGNYAVGWIQTDGKWYYRYPDGTYQKGWMKLNDKWYLMDDQGVMLTGWQQKNGQSYYIKDNGEMQTGWINADNVWYFLNTTKDGNEGSLVKNSWVEINGQTYYMTSTGAMAEGWKEVAGSWYYFYPQSGNKAVSTTIDTFYLDANGVWKK